MSLPIEHRLWSKVVKTESGCWEYTGYRDEKNYGKGIWHNGRSIRTHRLAYELTHGPIPEGLVVMHSCDNPPCCNPEHLSLGTVVDNNRDRDAKGRGVINTAAHGWQRNSTHCKQGHEYTPENTLIRYGHRCCVTCKEINEERRRGIRAAAKAAGVSGVCAVYHHSRCHGEGCACRCHQ